MYFFFSSLYPRTESNTIEKKLCSKMSPSLCEAAEVAKHTGLPHSAPSDDKFQGDFVLPGGWDGPGQRLHPQSCCCTRVPPANPAGKEPTSVVLERSQNGATKRPCVPRSSAWSCRSAHRPIPPPQRGLRGAVVSHSQTGVTG